MIKSLPYLKALRWWANRDRDLERPRQAPQDLLRLLPSDRERSEPLALRDLKKVCINLYNIELVFYLR